MRPTLMRLCALICLELLLFACAPGEVGSGAGDDGTGRTPLTAENLHRFLGDTGLPGDYLDMQREQMLTASDADSPEFPASFDWSKEGMVTDAKHQGACGSCWAFAVVGVLESKNMIKGGSRLDLSEQQQVSCNHEMWGCDGGNMDALKFWYDRGPKKEDCTGYAAAELPCSDLEGCDELSPRTRGFYTVATSNIDEMKASLYNDGPAYFRFTVYYDFFDFWNTYSPGAVYVQQTGSRAGGHAVLIIGWDDSKQAWLCKNSWGRTSGPNGDGTFWIAYDGHEENMHIGMANVDVANVVRDTRASLKQSYWRGGQGFSRTVPVVNGMVQWDEASAWSDPYPASNVPGSGEIQTSNSFVVGNLLKQAYWRGNEGRSRTVPIRDGAILWGQAADWSAPYPVSKLPGSGEIQAANNFVLGNVLKQSYWRGNQGRTRTVPIRDGVVQYAEASDWSAPFGLDNLPGSGDIQAQNNRVVGNVLMQGFWRGDQGFARNVPIRDGKPQWNEAAAWSDPYPLSKLPGSGQMQATNGFVLQ